MKISFAPIWEFGQGRDLIASLRECLARDRQRAEDSLNWLPQKPKLGDLEKECRGGWCLGTCMWLIRSMTLHTKRTGGSMDPGSYKDRILNDIENLKGIPQMPLVIQYMNNPKRMNMAATVADGMMPGEKAIWVFRLKTGFFSIGAHAVILDFSLGGNPLIFDPNYGLYQGVHEELQHVGDTMLEQFLASGEDPRRAREKALEQASIFAPSYSKEFVEAFGQSKETYGKAYLQDSAYRYMGGERAFAVVQHVLEAQAASHVVRGG